MGGERIIIKDNNFIILYYEGNNFARFPGSVFAAAKANRNSRAACWEMESFACKSRKADWSAPCRSARNRALIGGAGKGSDSPRPAGKCSRGSEVPAGREPVPLPGGGSGGSMSFKREGDDPSQLQVLQKRRVAELLANYIPEDEALLLRDGRYSCTICFQRPVFDTLDMLTVHRSGKKHLASLQKFYGKKRSLENEVQKRQQQAYLEAEESGTQVAQGPAPLLAQTRRITQNALLKTVPYSSCCRPKRNQAGASTSGVNAGSGAAETTGMPKPSSSDSVDEERQVEEEASPTVHSSGCRLSTAETRERKFVRQGKGRIARKSSEPNDPEKQRALEHYLKLKSSGWIQDGSGKWVKDENVEFDSDEEEPPMLPPP